MSLSSNVRRTPSAGRLPDFLVIGAMKSGTTTLFRDLESHPRIFMPEDKEPNILSEDLSIEQFHARYSELFRGAHESQKCGEASTMYTMHPMFQGAAGRAEKLMGNRLKLIYILRDPIRRVISHHAHWYATGRVDRDINRAILEEPLLMEFSRYASQLRHWDEHFASDNRLLLQMESYVADRQRSANRVFEFLGLEPFSVNDEVVANQAGQVRRVAPWLVRLRSSALYQKYIRGLLAGGLRNWLIHRVSSRPDAPPLPPTAETIERLYETLRPEAQTLTARLGADLMPYTLTEAVTQFVPESTTSS